MQKTSSLAWLIASTFTFLSMSTSLGAEVKTGTWFKNTDCSELSIVKYKSISDDKVIAETTIKNKDAIKDIISRITSLPADGDMMVKWGPKAESTRLTFKCASSGEVQEIQLIGKRFKTPSTGFNSEKSIVEDDLYRDLDGLVEPALNKRVLKIKDHVVKFKDFMVKFERDEHTPQDPKGPTIGPTSRVYFDIWENNSANKATFSIFDGQIPPQPQAFVVGKKFYYLLTYQNVAKESLSPKYFEISDKLPKR